MADANNPKSYPTCWTFAAAVPGLIVAVNLCESVSVALHCGRSAWIWISHREHRRAIIRLRSVLMLSVLFCSVCSAYPETEQNRWTRPVIQVDTREGSSGTGLEQANRANRRIVTPFHSMLVAGYGKKSPFVKTCLK